MRIYSAEQSKREHRRERTRIIKRNLAFSVLVRIEEELAEHPDTESFTAPLLVSEGIESSLSRRLLRDCPEAITRPLLPRIGREVLLRLDETVEPPMLSVQLGERIRR